MVSDENGYVASEIRRSGYPLEVEVAELLESSGWEVLPSVFYQDRDDNTYKETDLIAYKHIAPLKGSRNYPYRITIGVLLECKKREDIALVLFPRPRKSTDVDYGGVGLAAMDSFLVAKMSSFRALSQVPLPRRIGFDLPPKAFVPASIARQIWGTHQLPNLVVARDFKCLSGVEKSLSFDVAKLPKTKGRFRRNEAHQEIHLALIGLAKATDDILVKEAEGLQVLLQAALDDDVVQRQPELRDFWLYYFFAALVFDGKLKVWRHDVVTDVDETLFQTSLRSGQYFGNRFVSIVSKRHLAVWLKQLEADSNKVAEKLIAQRQKLDSQVELIIRNRVAPSG